MDSANVAELCEEGDLVSLNLWAIDTRQPPPWTVPMGDTLAVMLLSP